MKHARLWMLATILTFCGATTMSLTSCSNDDDIEQKAAPGPLASKLKGTWYSIYDAKGTAEREDGATGKVDYSIVLDAYNFDGMGVGTFQRFFFDEDAGFEMVQGILGYGNFTYSSSSDGKVNLTLANDWKQSYPHSWVVNYANNAITAKGVDGRELKLEPADEEMLGMLNALADKNGSGATKYEAKDYKPVNVDNSQWMSKLADNRLVADLSLPGSHDAVTAEGWNNRVTSVIAEIGAKTQDLTVREQLKIGMRVFDLRPERVLEEGHYALRCSHGVMTTNLLVKDFFQILKEYLATNPSEFCILTVDLSATSDKTAWGREFRELVSNDQFKGLFVDFKPRLTVGEMRGHVLILSRHEFGAKPIGGYCYGWVYDLELEKQTKGHITGPDGSETPLWVQDYWGKRTRDGKDEAVLRMLEAASKRDMTTATPAWVINYPSAYFNLIPFSDDYRENATFANVVTVNWLASHTGSVGIIYMDFGGMDKSPDYAGKKLYETAGMKLVDSVIKQNFK